MIPPSDWSPRGRCRAQVKAIAWGGSASGAEFFERKTAAGVGRQSVNRVERLGRNILAWREAVRNGLRQDNGIRCDHSGLCPEHRKEQTRHHHSEKKL
jgi:hypothetical protein